MPTSLRIQSEILGHIRSARFKMTPLQLLKDLQLRNPAFNRKLILDSIRELVNQGELIYSYTYGTHHLESSFEKPVRISQHVIIAPPGLMVEAPSTDIVIRIEKGAAFGSGMHPTTRLALRAIDHVCAKDGGQERKKHLCALDIGTGSGILAIAAAAFGFGDVYAVDVDTCAVAEAAHNVHLNGLDGSVRISAEMPYFPPASIHLLMANLRTPSILELSETLSQLMGYQGHLVLSGIHSHEEDIIQQAMAQNEWKHVWRTEEGGWSGLAFTKSQRPHS
jgi:ribosomal protein L11 methyltransferase